MRIVGIDTSSATASVALLEDGQVIAERCHPDATGQDSAGPPGAKSNHAEILLPLIEAVIAQAKVELGAVSGIALTIGPGSFTGLRIGLSTVKGLAYGWNIPVVGISTLLAHAARVGEFDGAICSLLDARKNEVYAALFRKRKQTLTRLTDDLLAPAGVVVERVRSAIEGTPCLFIGDAVGRYPKELSDRLGRAALLRTNDSVSSAAVAAARLGTERFRNAECDDLGQLVPVYLRRSEAETKKPTMEPNRL